jgi:predicted TIM-barrel fold metal-dependent hydrolase
MASLREKFFARGAVADCPILDIHGHMGPFYGARHPWSEPDATVHAMDRANVRLLVICHHAAFFCPEIGNSANVTSVRRYPDRLRAYCGINPHFEDLIERDLDGYASHADVFVGLKFHADFHAVPLTDSRYARAWRFADQFELPVLLHTWGSSPNNGPKEVRALAEKYPRSRILMGHSLHGHWQEAVDIANQFPNIYFDLAAVLDDRGILEKFVGECGARRVLFGSDFPWFDFHYQIGAILGSAITDEDRRDIFWGNARRLLGRSLPASLLDDGAGRRDVDDAQSA